MTLIFHQLFSSDPWDGILDATEHSALPIQNEGMMEGLLEYLPLIDNEDEKNYSEDCLYLSVYTPRPAQASYPVGDDCLL